MVAAKEYPNRKEKNIGVVKENLLTRENSYGYRYD